MFASVVVALRAFSEFNERYSALATLSVLLPSSTPRAYVAALVRAARDHLPALVHPEVFEVVLCGEP